MQLQPKYQIGDSVFYATYTHVTKRHQCPDCAGSRQWKAISPAGEEYSFPCPRCSASYRSNHALSLDYGQYVPKAETRTIGSIRTDTASTERPIEYMCHETGIGSGTLYNESDFFLTQEEAEAASLVDCEKRNTTTEHIVVRYNQSLSVADYTLSNASLEEAKRLVNSVSYKVQDLLSSFECCESMDEVKERIAKENGKSDEPL